MNNEIKQILDFKENADYKKLSCDEIAILKDYITNLQEKLEVAQDNEESYRLEMQDITKCLGLDEHTLFDDVKDYATNLQQENERLKENNMSYQEEMARTWKIADDYKSRIEKAVEYIKTHTFQEEIEFDNKKGEIHYGYFVDCKAKDLLDILNGRSDE